MSVLEEFNGTISEYEYQKRQERKQERKRKRDAKIIQALEDVRANTHASILMFRNEHYENKEIATGCDKLIESINDYIDDKIEEVKNDRVKV